MKSMSKALIAVCAIAMAGSADAMVSVEVKNLNGYDKYTIILLAENAYMYPPVPNMDTEASEILAGDFLSKKATSLWKDHYSTIATEFPAGTVNDTSATIVEHMEYQQYAAAVFMVLQDGITPGSAYSVFKTAYFEGDSDEGTAWSFDMSNAQVLTSGTLYSDAIPEPTSGLLLFVGLAGLALRRKRA